MSFLLKSGVIRVPKHHREAHVLCQLHEVLRGHRVAAVALGVGQVEDGRRVVHKEDIADLLQHLCRGGNRLP